MIRSRKDIENQNERLWTRAEQLTREIVEKVLETDISHSQVKGTSDIVLRRLNHLRAESESIVAECSRRMPADETFESVLHRPSSLQDAMRQLCARIQVQQQELAADHSQRASLRVQLSGMPFVCTHLTNSHLSLQRMNKTKQNISHGLMF